MPNRSDPLPRLPVVYVYTQPAYPAAGESAAAPGALNVYDVTYLHFHNLIEIGYCTGGTGICYVDGRSYPFRAGDVQIVFPFQRHLSKSTGDTPSRWYWLNVDGAGLLDRIGITDPAVRERLLGREMGVSGIIDRERYPEICRLARSMVREVFEPEDGRQEPMLCYGASFLMLLMALCQVPVPAKQPDSGRKPGLREIAPALLAIRDQVDGGTAPGVQELARLCGMSLATFRRRFGAAVGVAPKDYITACRIHRACRLLLEDGDKMIEIAGKCGFSDVSGFNRCFLKLTGLAPRDYRKRYGTHLEKDGVKR